MIYIIIGIIVFLVLILLFLYMKINNLKDEHDKIEVALNKINNIVNKKDENILNILDILKDEKLKSKYENKDNIIEKEENLFYLYWDINKYLNENKKKNKKLDELINEIECNEDELEGLKDFYNSTVNLYNSLYNKKPYTLLYKIFKFKTKNIFTSKRVEEFEILKD